MSFIAPPDMHLSASTDMHLSTPHDMHPHATYAFTQSCKMREGDPPRRPPLGPHASVWRVLACSDMVSRAVIIMRVSESTIIELCTATFDAVQ